MKENFKLENMSLSEFKKNANCTAIGTLSNYLIDKLSN